MSDTVSGPVMGFWRQAAAAPERIAVVDVDGTALTAGELAAQVNRISHALQAAGVQRGTDLAILTRNSAATLALVLAASQVGAYYTMVNSHLAAPEVAYILADATPLLLFCDGRTAELAAQAVALAGLDAAAVRCVDAGHGWTTMAEWSGGMPANPPAERSWGSWMLYTSGTSGRPKGVRSPLSDAGPDEMAIARTGLLRRYGLDPADQAGDGVHLVTSPLYHAAPLGNAAVALDLGHRVVVMDRFEPEATLRLIEQHGVTWTHVVPTMLRRLVDLPDEVRLRHDTSSLRWLLHAAAPCPVELKRQVIAWLGPVVWEYYSSTEGGGTVIGAADWLAHPGSVGRPWEGAHIRVLDADGNDLPPGEVGDVYFRNVRPFRYHNDPAKTEGVTRGDYVTAGDVGWLDAEGYLFLADRRTDLILVGGVNVYPAEVENALSSHPGVADAGVVGRPHPDLGQTVHAVVVPRDASVDHDAFTTDLARHLAGLLSNQKLPRSYEVRGELPRSEAGKLLRRVLRDELAG